MRRRLSIAIASLGSPQIIFFDEPTTGLDPVTKEQILDLIRVDLSSWAYSLGLEKGKSGRADHPLNGRGRFAQ
jgi:ABC-type phosphonate transport system ATPase subunit